MASPAVPVTRKQVGVQTPRLVRPFGLAGAAEDLSQLGGQVFKLAAQRTATESAKAGQRYGAETNPFQLQLSEEDTIAARAFNQGAVLTNRVKLGMMLDGDIQRISEDGFANPDLVGQKIEALRQEYSAVYADDPESHALVEQMVAGEGRRAYRQASGEWQAKQQDENRATALEAWQTMQDRIERAVYAGEDPTPLVERATEMMQEYSPAGPMGKYAPFSEAQLAGELMKLGDKIKGAAISGAFERADFKGKRALIAKLDRDIKSGQGDMGLDQAIKTRNYFDAEVKRQEADGREAVRFQMAMEERSARLAERSLKVQQIETSKNGDELLATGRLTPEWIQQNRPLISESDHRYFYRALRGDDAATTDPVTYTPLRDAASEVKSSDDLSRLRDAARDALKSRQIRTADYDRVMGIAESKVVTKDLPSWFDQGEQFIKGSMAQGQFSFDPLQAQRQANALDEWADFARQNPNATPEQAGRRYREVVDVWSQRENATESVLPRPRLLQGTAAQPDLDATEDATLEAYQRGEITDAELRRQTGLIDQWRAAQARKAARQQKP